MAVQALQHGTAGGTPQHIPMEPSAVQWGGHRTIVVAALAERAAGLAVCGQAAWSR